MSSVREIAPRELAAMKDEVTLVDVREPWEADICSIDGGVLIPMQSLPQRLHEIPRDRPVALYCHLGMRSLMAAQYLAAAGYDALSLAGGVDGWAVEVDGEMARY